MSGKISELRLDVLDGKICHKCHVSDIPSHLLLERYIVKVPEYKIEGKQTQKKDLKKKSGFAHVP